MSCTHSGRTVSWPGGELVQSPNGNWYQIIAGPEIVRHSTCPACRLVLPSEVAGDTRTRNIPGAAYSESYIERHKVRA